MAQAQAPSAETRRPPAQSSPPPMAAQFALRDDLIVPHGIVVVEVKARGPVENYSTARRGGPGASGRRPCRAWEDGQCYFMWRTGCLY